MKYFLLIVALVLTGCVSNPAHEDDAVAPITDEGKKKTITIDPRLLVKAPEFTEKLKSGDEEEVVAWGNKALDNAHACRVNQWALIDWVSDTFFQTVK